MRLLRLISVLFTNGCINNAFLVRYFKECRFLFEKLMSNVRKVDKFHKNIKIIKLNIKNIDNNA